MIKAEKKRGIISDKRGVTAIFSMLVGIGIAIAIIFVVFGVIIPQIGSQSEGTMDLAAYQYLKGVTGDSFTASNTTWVALDHSPIKTGSETIYNSTVTFTNAGNSNYTMNYTDGTIIVNTTGEIVVGGTYKANYTYGTHTNWYEIQTGMSSNVLSWVGSVNLVIVIALLSLVIMAVAGMMANRRQGGAGGI